MHLLGTVLLNAVVTIAAAYAGAHFASQGSLDLWQREKDFVAQKEAIEHRREIIKRMSGVLIEGYAIAQRHVAHPNDDKNPIAALLYCLSGKNRFEDRCRNRAADANVKSFFEEFLPLHNRFISTSLEVRLHFCADAIAAVERLPSGYWWWNTDDSTTRHTLNSLEADLNCSTPKPRSGR